MKTQCGLMDGAYSTNTGDSFLSLGAISQTYPDDGDDEREVTSIFYLSSGDRHSIR